MLLGNKVFILAAVPTYLRFGFKLILGGLIFAFVAWKVIGLFDEQTLFDINFHISAVALFGSVVILMFLNWSCEAMKWKVLMETVQPLSFFAACRAVFSGIATGILTPNRVGIFIGRVAKLNPELRVKGAVFTFYAGLIQFFITLFFGVFGLLVLFDFVESTVFWTILLLACVLLFFAFLVLSNPLLLLRRPLLYLMSEEIKSGIDKLALLNFRTKLMLFGWSTCRYFIFVSQYVLVLVAFGRFHSFFFLYAAVTVLYLLMTLVPSLFLGKLFVREAAGLIVLAWLGVPDNFIILSGFLVWLINIAIPALIGSVLLISKR